MPQVKIVEHINADPRRVWNLISDIEAAPQWVTVMEELIYTSDNPLKEGAIYKELSKIGPKTAETEWNITTFKPMDIQVHQSRESDMHIDLTMQVTPEGDGTSLLHKTEFTMIPKFRPLGWLLETLFVKRTMNRKLHSSVTNLKRLCESLT